MDGSNIDAAGQILKNLRVAGGICNIIGAASSFRNVFGAASGFRNILGAGADPAAGHGPIRRRRHLHQGEGRRIRRGGYQRERVQSGTEEERDGGGGTLRLGPAQECHTAHFELYFASPRLKIVRFSWTHGGGKKKGVVIVKDLPCT